MLQLRSPTAVYTFRKSRHKWTQSHFVQMPKVASTQDWASDCWRGRWHFSSKKIKSFPLDSVSIHVLFWISENQNPQQKLQHPKEIHGRVPRKWWEFRGFLGLREFAPIFTCSSLQGSSRNPIKFGAPYVSRFISPRYSLDEVHPSKGHIGQHVDDHRTP